MKSKSLFYLTCVIAIVFIIYSSFGIKASWSGEHNGCNGGWFSYIAINMIKYGSFNTKFGMPFNTNYNFENGEEKIGFFTHHSPLMSTLISIFFRLFGIHEYSARLLPIFLNVISIFLFYFIGKEYYNERVGFFSSFFLVLSPIFFNFRNFVALEAVTITFILSTIFFYLKWLKEGKNIFFPFS